MRKIVVLFLIFICCLPTYSKSEYLPSYFAKVAVTDGTFAVADSSTIDELSISASNNRYSVSVIHDSITEERLRILRRNEVSQVLSGIALFAGAVSTMYSLINIPTTLVSTLHQAQMYVNGIGIISISSISNFVAQYNIAELQKLPITIAISNNTDKEMYINDMSRGLTWYISSFGTLSLRVGNPEINQFRLAYADTTEPQVSYIMVQAVNCIDKYSIMYENDDVWILNNEVMTSTGYQPKYHLKNKRNLVNRIISEDVAYQMVHTLKKEDRKK